MEGPASLCYLVVAVPSYAQKTRVVKDRSSIDLAATDPTAPATVGPLAPGESEEITVEVEIPLSGQSGDEDTATVTATSQADQRSQPAPR